MRGQKNVFYVHVLVSFAIPLTEIHLILYSILRHTLEIVVCGLEAQEDEDIN